MGCPLTQTQVEELFKKANTKRPGDMTRQEFEWAFHTDDWLVVRAMAATKIQLMQVKADQAARTSTLGLQLGVVLWLTRAVCRTHGTRLGPIESESAQARKE